MSDKDIASYDVAVNETLSRMKLDRDRARMKANYRDYAAIPVIDEVARKASEAALSLVNPFVVRITKMPEIVRSIYQIYELGDKEMMKRFTGSYLQALTDKTNADIAKKREQ